MTHTDIASLLTRCREFIDTATMAAYPAGADIADDIDAALTALAAPAQPDTWRAAVLDALTATGSDMPVTATPAEIVRAVIDANVQIALDPRVSDAAPAQQPEPWAWGRVHPDGEFTGDLLLNTSIEDVRKRSGAWVPLGRIASPSVADRNPQPIATAPTDGTPFLAYKPGPSSLGWFSALILNSDDMDCEYDGGVHSAWDHSYVDGVTLWLPNPPAPKEQA